MDTNTFLGVAYYPEAWDISQVETDLDKMRDYGIGCVRIAEFAWKTMEPEEGKFDFSLFRKVVDECKKRGMYVIMGTRRLVRPSGWRKNVPTSTPGTTTAKNGITAPAGTPVSTAKIISFTATASQRKWRVSLAATTTLSAGRSTMK